MFGVSLFCLGSATTQRAREEAPVEWLIHLEDKNNRPVDQCDEGPEVVVERAAVPPNARFIIRFRMTASRPQTLEAFEHQLKLAAGSWCYTHVNMLRADMREGQFLADEVFAAAWKPATPP